MKVLKRLVVVVVMAVTLMAVAIGFMESEQARDFVTPDAPLTTATPWRSRASTACTWSTGPRRGGGDAADELTVPVDDRDTWDRSSE